jgi:phenylalanyl-tRNA synthetase alpha subunit
MESINTLLPARAVKIVPTEYPMCSQAWQLEIEDNGNWLEVLAWGVFTDRIVRHVGATRAVILLWGLATALNA